MISLENISSLINGIVVENEPMKNHTTYKIGGPADYYICPSDAYDLEKIIKIFKENSYPYFILGNGSNLLVSDEGYRGAVIDMKKFSTIKVIQNEISCGGGAMMSAVAANATKASMSGMEALAGIPGTIGGSLIMNAGCHGVTISDRLKYVEVILEDGSIQNLKASEIAFYYRNSSLSGKIIIKAVFSLAIGDKEIIEGKVKDYLHKRRKSQPLSLPSCGSVFKKPEGHYAGKLIEDAGLKGYTVGGAMVSKKHAGFIINFNHAKAQDVKDLIKYVKQKVHEKFNVELEEEVIFL